MKTRRKSALPDKLIQVTIFVGPNALTMLVMQNDALGKPVIVDVLSQPIDIARDIFRSGHISRDTMEQCTRIIESYQNLMEEYVQVGPLKVRLIGTNILADVDNVDVVVNRIHIATKLRLEVMGDGEMTRLLYLHSMSCMESHAELAKKRVGVIHVGPGNTRLIVFEKGRINYYARYREGAFRIAEAINPGSNQSVDDERSLIREHLRGTVEQMAYDGQEAQMAQIDALLFLSPDLPVLQSMLELNGEVSLDRLSQKCKEVSKLSINQRVDKYELDYATVRGLLPTLMLFQQIAAQLKPQNMYIFGDASDDSFLKGLTPTEDQQKLLEQEVLHFSQLLAEHYHVDPSHGKHVSKLSMSLFDQLVNLHQLNQHDRLLLHVAAILHEVGSYINPKMHQEHSQYIILNSEHFGLSPLDVEIVGLLALYHRHGGTPHMSQRHYAELDEHDRLRVQKLAALLRVADAMERSHARRISDFKVRIGTRRIELEVPNVQDLTLENLSLRSKADLFTDIFGFELMLVPAHD